MPLMVSGASAAGGFCAATIASRRAMAASSMSVSAARLRRANSARKARPRVLADSVVSSAA